MTLTDLRADWQARLDEAVELRDRRDAAGEPIPMGAEDTVRFRGLMDAADDLEMRIRELETEKRDHDTALRRLDAAQERAQLRAGDAPPLPGAATTRAPAGDGRGAFMAYMARGPEQARQATDYAQLRALQVDSDTGGGYLIMPMSIHADLIREVDDALVMRQISMVQPRLAVGQSLLAAIDDDSMDEAAWTGELTEIPEDDLNPLGQRRLEPRRLAKRFKISNELLMAPGFNHESYWLMRAARKLQEPQEKAFMTGTGANQPLGIFTAHAEGIPTSRDVSTGNTSTAITAQGIMAAFYSLKAQYMRNARFVLHRQAVRQLRELTANGQFLWQPGLGGMEPATILGRPFIMSEYAPSTFTTGQYVGVVGDFSKYWIVDSAQMMVQRLSELYAETNQTGYIVRAATDAAPVLAEAFVRIQLG